MILRTSIRAVAIVLMGLLVATIVVVSEANAATKRRVTLKRLAPKHEASTALEKLPDAWNDEESALSHSSLKDLYTPEITRGVEGHYRSSVAPLEQKTESPFRRARTWEVDQYNKEKQEAAAWTAKEVLSNRLKVIFSNADKSSGAMKAMHTMKNLMGGDDEPKKTQAQKGKSAKKGSSSVAQKEAYFSPTKKEEAPAIPTRLKTRMNVVKGQGEVRFTNPIVSTSVNLDANKKADNNVAVRMEKDLTALDLQSNVDYGLDKKVLSVNLSKKITDEITANVVSRRNTSGSELAGGKKSEEALNMSYSVSF